MNKLSKIFLGIIIILVILLVLITGLYFDMRKKGFEFRDAYIEIATELYNINLENENNNLNNVE